MRPLSLALAIGLFVAPGSALAQTCADEIALFAEQYGFAANLPGARPEGDTPSSGSLGVSPEDLARSGGVIAPPDEGGRSRVVRPDEDVDPMMTTPEVQPRTPQGEMAGKRELDAAKRTQMQSLLDAAREAHQRGDEKQCLERLARARAIPEPG